MVVHFDECGRPHAPRFARLDTRMCEVERGCLGLGSSWPVFVTHCVAKTVSLLRGWTPSFGLVAKIASTQMFQNQFAKTERLFQLNKLQHESPFFFF